MTETFADLIREVDAESRRLSVPLLWPNKAARLCELLCGTTPGLVVEVGTAIGYSGLWIAKTLADLGHGRLITLEQDAERANRATRYFERAGLSDRITQLVGDARRRIAEIAAPIDFLFLDGGFENYHACLKGCQEHLRDGALLVADNAAIGANDMADYLNHVRTCFLSRIEWFENDVPESRRDAIEITTYLREQGKLPIQPA